MQKTKSKIALYIFLASVVIFLAWRFVRPLEIFVVDDKFALPINITVPKGLNSISAKSCATCHREIYNEWKTSMHSAAWSDPYFRADFVFDGSKQICLNCHTPLANQQESLVIGFTDNERLSPILKPNPRFDKELQDEGVTCAVCHIRDGKIVGPFVTGTAPHEVIVDKSMASGMKPCVRCHVVSGDRWDTFYGLEPCGTVAEIQKSGREPNCIGCHMPEVSRPVATGMMVRKSGVHTFKGGHDRDKVESSLKVEYKKKIQEGKSEYIFILTNIGAAHFLPTGTPDRKLTLEVKLIDKTGSIIKEEIYTMKRYIMWRPFIVDLKDTRLPYGEPREYSFDFKNDSGSPATLDVKVRYHLLDEKRKKRIGYKNTEPINYIIYQKELPL